MSELRVAVVGGRKYYDKVAVFKALDALHTRTPIGVIIQGGAPGAATMAHAWADATPGVTQQVFVTAAGISVPADETPMQRSTRMFKLGKPNYVVAFPGGNGTAHEVALARAAKIPVWFPLGEPVAAPTPAPVRFL